MPIIEQTFDNEAELESWVKTYLAQFVPFSIQLPGFRIQTPSGKGGIPDGFAFDFKGRSWFIIENELLSHGVWPHIAEQVTRFVVASRNPDALRLIRDRLYDAILEGGRLGSLAHELGKPSERAFQELESFLFAIEPTLLVFIDDVDRDLRDFTSALAISSAVYRVKKLNIDGRIDFYSPDQKQPTIQTDDAGTGHELSTDLDILDQLGGGEVSNATGRFKCYKLSDGRTINIKRSKLHERGNYFWFGLGTAAMEYAEEFGVTDFVFVLGDRGIAVVPAHIVTDFVGTTNVASVTEDGRIRHYHFLISNDPSPHLYWSKEFPSVDLSEYFQIFD